MVEGFPDFSRKMLQRTRAGRNSGPGVADMTQASALRTASPIWEVDTLVVPAS